HELLCFYGASFRSRALSSD
ncbi:gatB/GatE catalytic domain protein, partial [Chlamydia psittaci 84-8471/1]